MAAGFKPKRKMYDLDFTGTDLEGLEIRVRSVSMELLLDLQEAYETLAERKLESLRKMFAILTGALDEWNLLDDDDEPLPMTVESIFSQDLDMMLQVIRAWSTAMSGVSAPLDGDSPSGETALEASLPMEVVSSNLVS